MLGGRGKDGGVPDAEPPSPPPLVWTIEGRSLPRPAELGECLRSSLKRRALATGQAPRLIVAVPGLRRPQVLAVEGDDLRLETPTDVDPRLSTAVHAATAGCLRQGASGLRGPGQQRWSPADWPTLGPGGGAPLDAFVQVKAVADGTRTLGLAAFGRPEVVAVGAGDAVEAAVRAAAVRLFVEVPAAPLSLKTPEGQVRLVEQAPWWPGGLPAGHWGLAHADDARPWTAPPRPARAAPDEPAAPRSAHPARPRRGPRPAPATAPASAPARRPASRAPVFLPDYR
ncbi:MAG: hypothetical protein H6702_20610 [Myxococcales bacterium]|nr:hypothetical protein [Myxococcales bacterium]